MLRTESKRAIRVKGKECEREDLKDVRIGRVSEKRNSLASERGHNKHTEQYQVLRGTGNLSREMRSWR